MSWSSYYQYPTAYNRLWIDAFDLDGAVVAAKLGVDGVKCPCCDKKHRKLDRFWACINNGNWGQVAPRWHNIDATLLRWESEAKARPKTNFAKLDYAWLREKSRAVFDELKGKILYTSIGPANYPQKFGVFGFKLNTKPLVWLVADGYALKGNGFGWRYKSTKPAFVPVSLDLQMGKVKRLCYTEEDAKTYLRESVAKRRESEEF